jgi:hypothetical protein
MAEQKIYRVFISHAWECNDDYKRFVGMLDSDPQLTWQNYSVPEEVTLNVKTGRLEDQLHDQIGPAEIVVILSYMQLDHRYWIQKEIDIAQQMNKPIIGIAPWKKERVLDMIQSAASEIIEWDTQSIVDAIKKHST